MYTRALFTMRQQCLCTVCRLAIKNDKINCSSCGSLTHVLCLGVRLQHTNAFKLSGGMFQCINCVMDDSLYHDSMKYPCNCVIYFMLKLLRSKPGADDFNHGLNDVLGVCEVICANATAYLPLFVSAPVPLTRTAFTRLCVTERSTEGIQFQLNYNFRAEEVTLYAWEVFLLNVEG